MTTMLAPEILDQIPLLFDPVGEPCEKRYCQDFYDDMAAAREWTLAMRELIAEQGADIEIEQRNAKVYITVKE